MVISRHCTSESPEMPHARMTIAQQHTCIAPMFAVSLTTVAPAC